MSVARVPVRATKVGPDTVASLFDGIKYVLLDCDGVLWAGDHVFPGVPDALRELKEARGCTLRFITNNGTMSRAEMLGSKFERLQSNVCADEVLTSAVAACMALRSFGSGCDGYDAGNVMVVGNPGLFDELRPAMAPGRFLYGLELRDDHGPGVVSSARPYDMKLCARCWDEPVMPPPAGMPAGSGPVTLASLNITTIVIGFDFCFSATTVAIASMLLQRHLVIPGASRVRYVTPNVDPQVNVGERNWRMPGTGSLQAAVQRASGRQPDIICGKPNPELLRLLLSTENEKLQAAGQPPLTAEQCLMVGDRMSTDIAFGRSAGARTLLVETGCETVADIPSEEEAASDPAGRGLLVPHFTAPGIVDAVKLLADVQS